MHALNWENDYVFHIVKGSLLSCSSPSVFDIVVVGASVCFWTYVVELSFECLDSCILVIFVNYLLWMGKVKKKEVRPLTNI